MATRRYRTTAPVVVVPPENGKDALPKESRTQSMPFTHEPQPMRSRFNVVLFGEMGAGKSSVVNLIMGKDVAKTSSNASSCTLDAKPYEVTIQGQDFRIFDTVGLNEPQELQNSDNLVGAIYKAYCLVTNLSDAGGVSLLLFCIRKGRITRSMEQNYQLFYDFLCRKQVPVALVITHLEHDDNMEDWWKNNQSTFAEYGIHTVGQACITAKRDFREQYSTSRQTVHDLLMAHGCGKGFMEERVSWLTELFQKLLDYVGIHPRWDNVKVRTRKFRNYGLNEREIDTLLMKISAVDKDVRDFRPRHGSTL